MKVCLIASRARSLVNFRGALIRDILANGHVVHAIVPGERQSPHVLALENAGVAVTLLPFDRSGSSAPRDLSSLLAMRRCLKELSPDVVLAYTIKPIVYGLVAAWSCGIRRRYALVTGLGYGFSGEAPLAVKIIVRALYAVSLRLASTVFFQNGDDLQLFRGQMLVARRTRTVVVNGSGIDLHHFPAVAVMDGPPRFLMIARFLKAKGIREFVEASKLVSERFPKAEFKVVGWEDPGNPDAVEHDAIKAWSTAGVVEFVGEMEDVRPALEWCSVYVLPSYREGTPRSVLEAMATGRAIITTDAPGCRETVSHGENGLLVPVRCEISLASAMCELAMDQERARLMGTASRIVAEQKFDVTRVNATMLSEMGIGAEAT